MKLLKRIWRNEAGLALPVVLMLLLFGGFLIAPTLAFMSTGLKAGVVIEERTRGYYAADAGIEDAYWKLTQGTTTFPYTIHSINDMGVTLSEAKPRTTSPGVITYFIKSTASLGGETKGEVIAEIRVQHEGGWGPLFQNAITSRGSVTIKPGAIINGDVQVPSEDMLDNKGTINGKPIYQTPPYWPTVSQVSEYYMSKVDTSKPYTKSSISITELASRTPLYRVGDLTIEGEGSGTLNGVVYVTGTLTIKPKKGSTINLNDKAIYSNKVSAKPLDYAIYFDPDSRISGSGSVVANGSINFQPNVSTSATDFLFVMSITSKTWFKPSGTFYGSAAGDIEVDVWPGFEFNGPEGGSGNPDFPPGPGMGPITKVELVKYSIEE